MTDPQKKSHIFLSYSSDDRDRAEVLARAIQAEGFDVWWDVDIPTGVHYPRFIENALKSASCVVVLWSANSTASRWVRNEADWGAENDTLVPVKIDASDIPWEFRNFQTLDLSHWQGDADDPAFARLLEGLAARSERRPTGAAEAGGVPATGTGTGPARKSEPTGVQGSGLASQLRWIVPAAAIILVAVVAFLAGKLGQDDRPASGPSLAAVPYAPPEQVTGDGRVKNSALSPDGKSLVFTRLDDSNQTSLMLKHLVTGDERELVPPAARPIRSPLFSPDGSYIFFTMKVEGQEGPRFDLFRISTFGSDPRAVITDVRQRRFDLSPDGGRLVFKRQDGDTLRTIIAGADGGDEQQLYVDPQGATQSLCLAWSADGRDIFTVRRNPESGADEIQALPVDGGQPRILPGPEWKFIMDVRSLLGLEGLLVVGKPRHEERLVGDLWLLPRDGGDIIRLTRDMNQYFQVSGDRGESSAGNTLALSFYSNKRILRVLEIGAEIVQRNISTDIVSRGHVQWTGANSLLVNQSVGGKVGLVEIDYATGAVSSIVTDKEWIADMARSPDGRRMAFQALSGEEQALWLANADGTQPQRLTTGDAVEYFPEFTPDGRWLVYGHREAPGRPLTIWRRPLEGGPGEQLCETQGWPPRVSPDGRFILSMFAPDYRFGTIPIQGGEPAFIDHEQGFAILTWNPRGDGFTAARRSGGELSIWNLPSDRGEPQQLAAFEAGTMQVTDADWSPDGKRLALCLQYLEFDVALLRRQQDAAAR